ncbi:MAG: hypothetical protein UY06_C0032G0008 [Candidatus Amesbacteria bacterium GW2011_GWA2_47_70]|nr:MAG: hypothetical protein UY06_C0032G0008 [Candidatus Amesbacteria bacterium GW2011_GWA2_47_70]
MPYGGTAYGLESAAQTYFGKKAADLNLAEAALLAGLPQAPSFYSPLSRPELAKARQEYVLKQMLDAGFIDNSQYLISKDQELQYIPAPTLNAPHFSLWVKDLLLQKYGLAKVEQDGLIVTTTLDLGLQNFAQAAVATEVGRLKAEKVGNGAVLVIRPKTGEILAMVGSKDYFDVKSDGNVNVTLSKRQPGSAIKPINYALALEHRLLTASTVLADKPTCFLIPDQEPYCPVNYDNQWHGPTQVRFALGNSFNIPAVKTLVLNGLENFVASSSAFGLTTFTDAKNFGPSITLGGGEVTMLDLATAYGVLANTGQRVNLNPILKITDRSGKILEEAPKLPPNTRVISPGSAYIVSHLLLDNGARSAAFGSSSYLVVKNHPEVSVKTGTTNDKRDNWTVGYNPDILVAVWVGNNDNSPMSAVASGVTGASPIWNKVISFALKDASPRWPVQPPDVIGALVCSLSGLKVPDNPPGNQPDQIEYQNHAVVFDPLGVQLCLDCAGGYGEADLIRLNSSGRAIR